MVASGTHNFIDSEFSDNEATMWGGGLYVGDLFTDTNAYTNAEVNLTDTLVSNNTSERAGGAVSHNGATLNCTATSSGIPAGFLNNTSTGALALSTIYLTNSGSFSSNLCDMDNGTTSSDNSPNDINIWNGVSNAQFNYGDNVTFECVEIGSQYICQ